MSRRLVPTTEFKENAAELIRRIEDTGESVIVTDDGKPIVEICPYRSAHVRALDLLRGSVRSYVEPTGPVDSEWQSLD